MISKRGGMLSRAKNNGTGVALFEVFNLPQP